MNEIKELTKWRDIMCLWIGRLNIVKMSVLPNWPMNSMSSQLKIPANYFVNIEKLFIVYMERQKTQNNQYNIEGEEQSERTDIQCQDFLFTL